MDFESSAAQGQPVRLGMETADPPAAQAFDPVRLELGDAGEDGRRLVFCKYHRRVQRFFAKKGVSPEEAQELTHDTFVRVLQGKATLASRAQLEAWLFEIARNVWLNALRSNLAVKRKATEISLDELQSGRDSVDLAGPTLVSGERDGLMRAITSEQVEALRRALAQLPDQMRQCVRLRLAYDLKYREIAAVLRISIQTVKSHLHDGKKRLRALLATHLAPIDTAAQGDRRWR